MHFDVSNAFYDRVSTQPERKNLLQPMIGTVIGRPVEFLSKWLLNLGEGLRRCFGMRPIPSIDTSELVDRIRNDDVLLIDVRSKKEQRVSMIPGAIPYQDIKRQLASFDGDSSSAESKQAVRDRLNARKSVVCYCTIGTRSYFACWRLQRQFSQVANYQQSILGWVRANQPLADEQNTETKNVHLYWPIFDIPNSYRMISGSD